MLPLSEVPGGGVRFNDSGKQQLLKKELESLGVKYWEQKDGTISYLLVETAKFRQAERKIAHGEELNSNIHESIPLSSEFERNILKDDLKRAGIQFNELADEHGETNIYWSQLDGPTVDVIIQKVKVEAYKQFVNKNSEEIN